MARFAAILTLSICLLGSAAQAQDAVRGQTIAQRQCALCHIPRDNAPPLGGAAAVPKFADLAKEPTMSKDRVAAKLASPTHPKLPVPLTPEQIADVAAYIISLKGQ